MKNLAKIFMMVTALFAFACTTDVTEDLGVQLGDGAGQTTITLSLEESRTQLGEKAGDLYPLYWSEGDAIAANGYVSNTLTAEQAGSAGATFSFAEVVARPWCVVYPAPAAVAAEEVVEGEGETTPATVYPVEFLATQPYTVGSFAPKAAPMYAYAVEAAEGEEIAPIQLHHLTGVLRLAVKGNSEAITSVTVKALNGKIAGPFTIDCATGALTALEGAGDTVTMTFAEPLVLGAEAAPIYLTVPAGSHGVFLATLHTANNKMTVKFNSDIKPITAGAVREFGEFVYTANTADENGGVFEIDSKEALIEFARIASVFAPRAEAKVVANIDMSGYDWKPIENFGEFVFDGGGKTITGLNAPLFGTTAATIQDLTLANVALKTTDSGRSGAFACCIVGGSLVRCSASGTSTIDGSKLVISDYVNSYAYVAHGGLVGYINGGTIDHCSSDVDITIDSFCEASKSYKAAVGGIVGSFANYATLTNLTNTGDITYQGTTQKATIYMSGIVGRDVEAKDYIIYIKAISNCTNSGAITTAEGSITEGAVNLSGITGFITHDNSNIVTCANTVNSGEVIAYGESELTQIGGLIGNSCGINLEKCSNSGKLGLSAKAKVSGYAYVAGITRAATNVTIDDCDNTGAITGATEGIVFTSGKGYSLAGILVSASNCTITNCSNGAIIKQKELAYNSTATDYTRLAGICAIATGSTTFSGCENSGNIIYEPTDSDQNVSGIAMGGIVAFTEDKKSISVSECENSGNIVYNVGKAAVATVAVGGVVGLAQSGTVVTGCTNTSDSTIGGKGDSGLYLGLGGIVGMTSRGGAKIIDCKNYGTISQTDTNAKKPEKTGNILTNGYGFGGIVGIARSTQEISGCENWGPISLANTNYGSSFTVRFSVGGVIGWYFHQDASDPAGTRNKTIKNCANYYDLTFTARAGKYYAGGVIGCITTFENANHYWSEISGLKNVANLTFDVGYVAGADYALGGIIGNAEAYSKHTNYNGKEFIAIDNCTFYGDLVIREGEGREDFVQMNELGIFMGCDRTAGLHIATNSKVGGMIICKTENIMVDPGSVDEGILPTYKDVVRPGELDNSNWFKYLYTAEITEAVATGDGCSLLKEKPTVPTPTVQ